MLNIHIHRYKFKEMYKQLIKLISLSIYYCFAIHLPQANLLKMSKPLREFLTKRILDSCGDNIWIEKGAYFGDGSERKVGNNSGYGPNAMIGKFTYIGNNVMMARDVIILTRSHKFNDINIPMNRQGFEDYCPVVIEDDVWIAHSCSILDGVSISNGSVIAAGSVVNKNVDKKTIVGGVPAKTIKVR